MEAIGYLVCETAQSLLWPPLLSKVPIFSVISMFSMYIFVLYDRRIFIPSIRGLIWHDLRWFAAAGGKLVNKRAQNTEALYIIVPV